MSELTDLEIRMTISLIELNKQFPKAKSIEFDKTQNCFWVDSVGFTSWPLLNPLTDDALCFQLMNKYGISLINHENTNDACYAIWAHSNETPHPCSTGMLTNQNKAICLAIIEAHKEQ